MDIIEGLDSIMWYSYWMIGFNFSISGKYVASIIFNYIFLIQTKDSCKNFGVTNKSIGVPANKKYFTCTNWMM